MMEGIFVGGSDHPMWLDLAVGNRHGLIAGATGTGKTVSLRVLTEGFSAAGVPVFLADVKGDLGGLARPGEGLPAILDRAAALKTEWRGEGLPVVFWDVFGRQGHPVRATVSDVGPILLARMLSLNETQEGVLQVTFRYADDEGLLLLDLKDLRALLSHLADNSADVSARYGAVAPASVAAIQRALLALENQGGDAFFGEPALDFADLMLTAPDGRGAVSVLAADELLNSPRLYATVLLWMLSELFENLPEVGDVPKPKLVFFFDEAHLLFEDAPPALVAQIQQVVRLIRSKGVGIYFVTQSPLDIPERVLGQLGHRIQHALRAFTPRDQKAVRAAAETMRANPALDTVEALQQLAKGEALVSLLDANGVPSLVQRTMIAPPRSSLAVLPADERQRILDSSPIKGRYDAVTDRESAYELLALRANAPAGAPMRSAPRPQGSGIWTRPDGSPPPPPQPAPIPPQRGQRGDESGEQEPDSPWGGGQPQRRPAARRTTDSMAEAAMKSVARGLASSIGSTVGRQIARGVLGAILKR